MTEEASGVWSGLADLPTDAVALENEKAGWVAQFADELYGPVPDPPDALKVEREPCGPAERLLLTLKVGPREAQFDALLWMPEGSVGPVPLILALDFLGPFGLPDVPFPADPDAIICAPAHLGGERQTLTGAHRGQTGSRWPIEAIHAAGFGLLISCYGSWVPDDARQWRVRGLNPLIGADTGAISLWAWALMRLVDGAATLTEVADVFLAGHSRLGKAALWAAANDPRVAGVFANASGCAGAAPAAHRVGETLAQLSERYPHWLRDGAKLPEDLDQHHLLASVPGAVVLTLARDDLWADPVGSYRALTSASGNGDWPAPDDMWLSEGTIRRGRFYHGLRDGRHDLTAEDWKVALPFLRSSAGIG